MRLFLMFHSNIQKIFYTLLNWILELLGMSTRKISLHEETTAKKKRIDICYNKIDHRFNLSGLIKEVIEVKENK